MKKFFLPVTNICILLTSYITVGNDSFSQVLDTCTLGVFGRVFFLKSGKLYKRACFNF